MQTPPWIALLGVIGTWLIFIAAIWGERIRSWLFKPQLQIRLVNPAGELTTEKIISIENGDRKERERPARYYYLCVTNPRRWPVANNVQIVLTRVGTPDPSKQPQIIWQGDVPFQWPHPQLHPLSRTVGPLPRQTLLWRRTTPRTRRSNSTCCCLSNQTISNAAITKKPCYG